MRRRALQRRLKRLGLWGAITGLTLAVSGCSIDGGALVTDMVEAGLNSVTESLVNALSEQLARD